MNWPAEETMTSAQRKLKRGIEHVRTLLGEVRSYEEAGAYIFDYEQEIRSETEAVYRCFADRKVALPMHWPLLAGEAIQNLRAALDHLVYEKSGGKSSTSFPIFTDRKEYEEKAPGRLKGVSEEIAKQIAEFQPFRFMPEDASQHPLAQLSSLSNRDKHKVLSTVASAVTREGVGIPAGVKLKWDDYGTLKELGAGRRQISTFMVRAKGGVEDVTVEPHFSYEVRIERHPIGVLKGIGHEVFRVMGEIETGGNLSPVAPFPL
ncbi:MAG TPA: hypothetical protein VGO13_08035 [Solirubrobacterales bacterium]|nr:hypothetical protein [Solirubrobacterales bacterium]